MNLRMTQGRLLALLLAFDAICREACVNYTLHGGTLLGGVREKGFISWDDDADIAMSRGEFEKLQRQMGQAASRFHIAGGVKTQLREVGIGDVWIDIFICDHISERRLAQWLKKNVLTALDIMSRDGSSIELSNIAKYGKFRRAAFMSVFHLGRFVPAGLTARLYAWVSRDLWLGNRSLYFRSNDQYQGREKPFPVEWLDEYRRIPFEVAELSVSSRFHDILVSCYGANYMTPIRDDRNRKIHDMVRMAAKVG